VAAAIPVYRALRAWAQPSAIILVAAAIAAAPVRLHGPFCGDDFQFHAISWLDAQHSWRQGIAYPHWAPSPNFGAGEPRFLFYPPLTWMLGAALGTLLPWAWVGVTLTFLLLAATGLATRKLARHLLPDAPSILAGCIAIFSLHALFTAYDRAAFGELTGGLWMPLLLLFALRDRRPDASVWRRALDGSAVPLALVVAGAWLSNVPVGVMTCYLLAAVVIAATLLARSWFPVLRASIAVTFGLGAAAIYLVPAVWEQRWVDSLEATGVSVEPGLNIENNWLFGHSALPSMQWHNVFLHSVSQLVLAMIAIALGSAFIVWLRSRRTAQAAPQRRLWIILACIPVAILFLQLPISPISMALARRPRSPHGHPHRSGNLAGQRRGAMEASLRQPRRRHIPLRLIALRNQHILPPLRHRRTPASRHLLSLGRGLLGIRRIRPARHRQLARRQ
jgi:hypothetical protein